MLTIRPRDLRAILFCALSSLVLAIVTYVALKSVIIAAALTAAWLAFLMTRPRMRRVMRRLRGEPVDDGWGNYFQD